MVESGVFEACAARLAVENDAWIAKLNTRRADHGRASPLVVFIAPAPENKRLLPAPKFGSLWKRDQILTPRDGRFLRSQAAVGNEQGHLQQLLACFHGHRLAGEVGIRSSLG